MQKVSIGVLSLAALMAAVPIHAAGDLDRAMIAIEAYDYPRALPPLRTAATQGDRRAQRLLGFMLLHGERLFRGISADPTEAMTWFRKASAQGDEQAAWVVARIEHGLVAKAAPR